LDQWDSDIEVKKILRIALSCQKSYGQRENRHHENKSNFRGKTGPWALWKNAARQSSPYVGLLSSLRNGAVTFVLFNLRKDKDFEHI